MSVDCDDQIATYGNRNIADVCALIATAQAGVFRGPAGQHLNDEQPRIGGQAIWSASSGVMGIVRTPSAGRRTRPSVTRSFSTAFAVLIGMAKPIPALCPTFEAIRVLM